MKYTKEKKYLAALVFLLSITTTAQETNTKEMQELFEDAFPKPLSYNFYSDIVSYGPYSDKYCTELGSEAKSHQLIKDASLSFLQKETKRITSFRSAQEALKASAEGQVVTGGNVELIGVEYQLDTHMLIIDSLIGEGGMIENRKIISKAIEKAELKGLEEFDSFKNEIKICRDQLSNAARIAADGCNRVEIVETCNEDGSSCQTEEVKKPVEWSCLAAGSIPHLENVISDYDDFYSQVLPTALHELGYKNLVSKFERFNANNIYIGDWKSDVDSCESIVQNLYKKTAVSCATLRADGTDEVKWNVPELGDSISDVYEAALNRTPDAEGLKYWQDRVAKSVTEGKTEQEAYEEIRGHMLNSKERALVVLKDNREGNGNLSEKEIQDLSVFVGETKLTEFNNPGICDRLDCKTSVKYEEKFETNEKLITAAEAFMKVITENEAEYAYFGALATEKAKWLDIMIGQSINRIEPLPEVVEKIARLDKKDLDYALVVMKEFQELSAIYINLLKTQETASGVNTGSLASNNNSSGNVSFGGTLPDSVTSTSPQNTTSTVADIPEEQEVPSANVAQVITPLSSSEVVDTTSTLSTGTPPEFRIAYTSIGLQIMAKGNETPYTHCKFNVQSDKGYFTTSAKTDSWVKNYSQRDLGENIDGAINVTCTGPSLLAYEEEFKYGTRYSLEHNLSQNTSSAIVSTGTSMALSQSQSTTAGTGTSANDLSVSAESMSMGKTNSKVNKFRSFQLKIKQKIAKVQKEIEAKSSSVSNTQLSAKKSLAARARTALSKSKNYSNRNEAVKNVHRMFNSPQENNIQLKKMGQKLIKLSSNGKKVSSKSYLKKNYSFPSSKASQRKSRIGLDTNTKNNFANIENNQERTLKNKSEIDSIYTNYKTSESEEIVATNGNDINTSNKSIFKILSKRYLESGLRRLSSKVNK